MEALGHQHQQQFYYRPPSLQSQEHISPDSNHPQSPPAPQDLPQLYQVDTDMKLFRFIKLNHKLYSILQSS